MKITTSTYCYAYTVSLILVTMRGTLIHIHSEENVAHADGIAASTTRQLVLLVAETMHVNYKQATAPRL